MVNEIGLEIRDVFPAAQDALYMLIGVDKSFSEEALLSVFDEHKVNREDWDRLLDMFLWYGVLGVDIPGEDSLYSYSVNYNMKMLKGRGKTRKERLSYVVNPTFQAALGVG
jgi:hypothetical protein